MAIGLVLGSASMALAQIDPYPRSLLQLGYDQSLSGQGPQSLYAYYYYNNPEFLRTNVALRLAVAPVYLDGELGFRRLLSPHTDVGIGINGGGYGENYYEVRQGHYYKSESFDGHGGGASLNLYHLINPARLIPLNVVVQGGAHYSTYSATDKTDDQFKLPDNRVSTFARAGLRFAGKEPMLYPDLAMEVSIWFERQWRLDDSNYGFSDNPLRVQPTTDLYWLYAGLSYAWTNTGNQFTFALTAGGSDDADRFSAWRLGGVLPLAAEFPLTLPGYYYQEISARRFVHLSAAYIAPLSADHRWQLRLGAASAYVDYLPGFEQPGHWNTGVGPSLSFTSRSEVWRVILRYGYGFNALRDGREGAHSVGVLFQYNFEQRKYRNKTFK
ncbi:MAG: hypothetical protein ABSB84_14765 [Verrucomicrobiota bacterium]